MNDSQTAYLDITPSYFVLAFVWALFKPMYSIDGSQPQVARWGQNLVPVAPGGHQVRVWCPYLFLKEAGLNTINVDARPASVTKVSWKAPWIVFLQGKIEAGPGELAQGSGGYGALPQSPAASGTPADWYADPQGRHEKRYWDGNAWTTHVSDAGATSEDAL